MRIYDSGLSAPIRTLVRAAVIQLLAPLLRSNGAFAQCIEGVPDTMKFRGQDDYELDILLSILNGRAPAYGVAVGDMKVQRGGAAGNNVGQLDVEVYSFCNHWRHLVLGRLASDQPALAIDTRDPGIEVMVEMVRMYLTDQLLGPTLGTKAKELRLVEEHCLITHREQTLWCTAFTVQVELQSKMNRGVTQYLTELYTAHRIGAGEPPPVDIDGDPVGAPRIETITTIPHP